MKRVAINGFGRIGRNLLRAYFEQKHKKFPFKIVAINDLGKSDINAHLLKYDSVHGNFDREVSATQNELIVSGQRISYYSERDINRLPWKSQNIDLVLECTGLFTARPKAEQHIVIGANQVLISAPGKNADATIVYGVNHNTLKTSDKIISNASCTTNCLAPIVDVLEKEIGIESGLATTVHAYTNDQNLTDSYHSDARRARSATQSMIPAQTGAAAAIGEVIPALKGRLDGFAIRVPVINTSSLDLTLLLKKQVNVQTINEILRSAALGKYFGILAYNDLPLVSQDFNHHCASAIVDMTQTKVIDKMVKVFAWYDNEWAFANRMLDTATVICQLHTPSNAESSINNFDYA